MTEVHISRQGSITVNTPSRDAIDTSSDDIKNMYEDPSPNRLDISQIKLVEDDQVDRMVDSVLSSGVSRNQEQNASNIDNSNTRMNKNMLNTSNVDKKFDDIAELDNLLFNDTLSGVIGGYNSTSVKNKSSKGQHSLAQSSHDQYVALLEKENLELSERVLNLERDLADSDQRYEKVSTENKQLLEELRQEIARSDKRAKEISTSLVDVRRETEKQANTELAFLRNELDLAVAKRVELENAFHVQTRTIAELTGESLELQEEMKNMKHSTENEAVLNEKLISSSNTILELQNRLNEAQQSLLESKNEILALRRESTMSQNKIIEESRIHNKSELELNETMENIKREMKQLEDRERKLRDDLLKKEGALGAMSHDRLKAVHDLVLKEEELARVKASYEKAAKIESNIELEYKKKLEEMKLDNAKTIDSLRNEFELKTKSYILSNSKAEETIQHLNNLINQKARENSELEIKCTTMEQKAISLEYEVNTLREVSEAARNDLSVSKSNINNAKDELHKSKLKVSSLEEANIQTKHENSKLKRKIAEINSERSKIISVIKNQGEALSKLTLEHKSTRHNLRKLDGTLLEANNDFQTIVTQTERAKVMSQKHVEKLIIQEKKLATQEIEIEDLKQNVVRADIEHKTIAKLRGDVNEWRNKFVGMERAAEDATEICNELKREFGLMETKFKNELEMRKGIEMEYERLKDLVKPQTETMEQMAIELKRALEREQTVRNELRSVHAKFAQQFM